MRNSFPSSTNSCFQTKLAQKPLYSFLKLSLPLQAIIEVIFQDQTLDRYTTRCTYGNVISFLFDTEMQERLSKMYPKLVSTSTSSRHLHEYDYRKVSPQSTHVLTADGKHRRVQWAKRHESDDFTSTIFTDDAIMN